MKIIFMFLIFSITNAFAVDIDLKVNNIEVDSSKYKLKAKDKIKLTCTNDKLTYQGKKTIVLATIGISADDDSLTKQGVMSSVIERTLTDDDCRYNKSIPFNCAIFSGGAVINQKSIRIATYADRRASLPSENQSTKSYEEHDQNKENVTIQKRKRRTLKEYFRSKFAPEQNEKSDKGTKTNVGAGNR